MSKRKFSMHLLSPIWYTFVDRFITTTALQRSFRVVSKKAERDKASFRYTVAWAHSPWRPGKQIYLSMPHWRLVLRMVVVCFWSIVHGQYIVLSKLHSCIAPNLISMSRREDQRERNGSSSMKIVPSAFYCHQFPSSLLSTRWDMDMI